MIALQGEGLTVVVAEVPEGKIDDELDIQCESLLATCDCAISHLDDSVSGSKVGVNSLLEKRHGARRTETVGAQEHAGAALRGANDIAAGSEQGIGLYEHIKF